MFLFAAKMPKSDPADGTMCTRAVIHNRFLQKLDLYRQDVAPTHEVYTVHPACDL